MRRQLISGFAALLLVGVLAACGGSDSKSTTTSAANATSTPGTATTENKCPEGTWRASGSNLSSYFEAINSSVLPKGTAYGSPSGALLMTLAADGKATIVFDKVSVPISSGSTSFKSGADGTMMGTWAATASTISFKFDSASVAVTKDGAPVATPSEQLTRLYSVSRPFSCEIVDLVISFDKVNQRFVPAN